MAGNSFADIDADTILGQKSERNPYGTLPKKLSDFCPVTVEIFKCGKLLPASWQIVVEGAPVSLLQYQTCKGKFEYYEKIGQ